MGVKDTLSSIGWIFYFVLIAIAFVGIILGVKLLYAWVAEQFGIPYIWVL